jgi:peroxiredoxin
MRKLILIFALLAIAGGVFAQYTPGSKARDFKLQNVDGKTVSLADFKNAKGFIVIFSCNHCPFVVATEDRMMELDKKFKPLGYPVIAINPNDPGLQPEDSFKNMQKRAKEKKFTFPYLHDDTQTVALDYGATRTPHVFILSRSGADYIVKYIGSIDDSTRDPKSVKEKFVEKAIAALEAGEEPNPSETKAVGCTIKWRN